MKVIIGLGERDMNLVKEYWCEKDRGEFLSFLESFKREDKVLWTKNILNTNMDVLAIKSPEINMIVKEIKKGNYLSFLDLEINNYYECVAISGKIIAGIKDFNKMKKYLDKYSRKAENWAVCDLLKFNIKGNEDNFFELAKTYSSSELPFVRRIGILILFEFISEDKYIDGIYEVLNEFYYEKEYYVNMVNAWLLCELFIKRREDTIKFLGRNLLNSFTVNKFISKCRDSFRVSKNDKEFLLQFKK